MWSLVLLGGLSPSLCTDSEKYRSPNFNFISQAFQIRYSLPEWCRRGLSRDEVPKASGSLHLHFFAKVSNFEQTRPEIVLSVFNAERLIGKFRHEMTISPQTRGRAHRLLTYEAVTGETSVPTESASLRVYAKLRRPLCALAGVVGFRSLASRALTLARAEAPNLSAVQITMDGNLQGLNELEPQIKKDGAEQGDAILIAQLLGLLCTFIGEALTLRLVRDVWPDAAFDDRDSGNGRKA
jgi:hypothetical protein